MNFDEDDMNGCLGCALFVVAAAAFVFVCVVVVHFTIKFW